MDLRAPLPPEYCIALSAGDGASNVVEQSMKYLLCRMYLASQMMEVGSESRFTSTVLFRRYVGRFRKIISQKWHEKQNERHQKGRKVVNDKVIKPSLEEMQQIKRHLGRIAAACLFLGCKAEEEPRRIRDIINLSSILDFEGVGREESSTSTKVDGNGNIDIISNLPTTEALEIIVEAQHPPPLDEKYWSDKEQMVSTEQQLLRTLQFDTLVCHPHRCVLIVMDTLDFGRGTTSPNQNRSLLSPTVSEALIFKAWTILNEISVDVAIGTTILQYNVVTLACAVIGVAATANRKGDATLPEEWWRSLDVPTDDFLSATESIQTLLHDIRRRSVSAERSSTSRSTDDS